VDFALEFEDAGPAAVFKEGSGEPEKNSGKAEEGKESGAHTDELAGEFGHFGAGIRLPDFAFESVAAVAGTVGEVGEEIEVGIAGDFGMGFEESLEFGIVAGDVVLIGEEGGVVGDDLGEGRAHAEETHELGAGVGEVAVVGDWHRGCRDGGLGGLECVGWSAADEEE